MNDITNSLTIKLDNDFTVFYEHGLDGGGHYHLPDFALALRNKKYKNAVEWCAGFGVIGFDLINRNVCETISFIDCYAPAINWINTTASVNKISDKVTTYVSDNIAAIPENIKWDLLVANPPHCFDKSTKEYYEKNNNSDPNVIEIALRLMYDEDFQIHKEFFSNIRNHLVPGADLFISEVGEFDAIEALALAAGLLVINRYPADRLSLNSKTNAVVFHFKEPL